MQRSKIILEVISLIPESRLANVLRFVEELSNNHSFALSLGRSSWDFPVFFKDANSIGINECEIRALFHAGFIRLAVLDQGKELLETTALPRRPLHPHSLIVLKDQEATSFNLGCESVQKPVWDLHVRELHFNGKLVKKFKWSAFNQEAVLAAFEEEGWPSRIFDPLKPSSDTDTRRRLHDTIRCLNQRQQAKEISFHGDGTGEGVCWQVVPA